MLSLKRCCKFKIDKRKLSLSAQSKHFVLAALESFTLIEPLLFEQTGRIGDLPGAAPAYVLLWFYNSSFKKKVLSNQQRSFFSHNMLKLDWFQNRSQPVIERFEWGLDSVNWEIAANSLCLWNRVVRTFHSIKWRFWQNWLYNLLSVSMNWCFPVCVREENPPKPCTQEKNTPNTSI